MTSTEITAHTILPAQREDIELKTADGLTLVGELALPPHGRPPVATLVTLHPLPTHAGMMDSHVYRKAAWRLPALADLAVLRFNTRGTSSPRGTSEGAFGEGVDERYDVAAAIDFADHRDLPNLWLVGWSFGTELTLKYGCEPQIQGAILLSPPLRRATDADIQTWAASGKPVKILVPEFDDYLRPDAAAHRFAPLLAAAVGVGAGVGVAAGDAAAAAAAVPIDPASDVSPGSAVGPTPNSAQDSAPASISPPTSGSASAPAPAPGPVSDPSPSPASAPAPGFFSASTASELIPVSGAKHLWVGEKFVKIVLDEIARATNPSAAPLPTEYDGRFGPATKYGA